MLIAPRSCRTSSAALRPSSADLIKSGVQVALHAPLPWNAMTYSTTRYRLLHALRDSPPQVRRFLILEITDLSAGLPQSRLTEVVSMLAPYCRAVLARAPSDSHDVRAWRGCGLSGVTLDCRSFDASDRKGLQRCRPFFRGRGGARDPPFIISSGP